MACAGSDTRYLPASVRQSVKLLVAGAFGVGKTTLIGSVSEIAPLRTEETLTIASEGVDNLTGLEAKQTTTVAMDFGRVTISPRVMLYLFGTPGQRRFWDLWEGLADGAAGVLVLVDTRRLQASFEVLDELELHKQALPFTVAVNRFPDSPPPGSPPGLPAAARAVVQRSPGAIRAGRERLAAAGVPGHPDGHPR